MAIKFKWALGPEVFLQAIRYKTELPGYFVSNYGRVASLKKLGRATGELIDSLEEGRLLKPNSGAGSHGYAKYNVYIPLDLYEDGYNFFQCSSSVNTMRQTITGHRLVMETHKPIDLYPPISMEDWKRCPASAKQWIRDTVYVDHIDSNRLNNHVDNLRWCTPKDNEPNRKAAA